MSLIFYSVCIYLPIQWFPCYMMNEMGHLAVFKPPCSKDAKIVTLYLFLAINMFTYCYPVFMHKSPLYFPENRLKHPSGCTILKVVFRLDIVLGGHAPDPHSVTSCPQCSLSPSHHLAYHFTQEKHCNSFMLSVNSVTEL